MAVRRSVAGGMLAAVVVVALCAHPAAAIFQALHVDHTERPDSDHIEVAQGFNRVAPENVPDGSGSGAPLAAASTMAGDSASAGAAGAIDRSHPGWNVVRSEIDVIKGDDGIPQRASVAAGDAGLLVLSIGAAASVPARQLGSASDGIVDGGAAASLVPEDNGGSTIGMSPEASPRVLLPADQPMVSSPDSGGSMSRGIPGTESVASLGAGALLSAPSSLTSLLAGALAAPLLAWVLYRRIQPDGELSHSVRGAIYARLGKGPATAADLAREHSVHLTTVTYHLHRLAERGYVRQFGSPGATFWALPGAPADDAARLRAQHSGLAKAVSQNVREAPGLTTTEVARLCGARFDTVYYHLRNLSGTGLIQEQRDADGRRRWFPQAGPTVEA